MKWKVWALLALFIPALAQAGSPVFKAQRTKTPSKSLRPGALEIAVPSQDKARCSRINDLLSSTCSFGKSPAPGDRVLTAIGTAASAACAGIAAVQCLDALAKEGRKEGDKGKAGVPASKALKG